MEKWLKTIERLATGKIIIVLILLATVAVFIYKNFDFITEITFKVDRQSTGAANKERTVKSKKSAFTDLEIADLQITPFESRLPSYLFFEVKNTGNASASSINLYIDAGRAKIIDCELSPAESTQIIAGGKNANISKFLINSLNVDETVYVYCQLSAPVFNTISLNSENLPSTSTLKFSDVKNSGSSMGLINGNFMTFLRLLFGAFILIAAGFFSFVLFGNLARLFKVDKL